MNNHIIRSLKFSIPALVLAFGAVYAYAWTGPTLQPPAGNVTVGGGSSLPTGTSGQTLRHDGTNWVANSVIFNNGTNVGIGTTGPNAALEVVKSGNSIIASHQPDVLAAGKYAQVTLVNGPTYFGANDRSWQLENYGADASNADLRFQYWNGTTYSNPLTVLANGNVGISTTAPASKLSFGPQGPEGIANTIRVYDDGSANTSDTSNSYGIGMRASDGRLAFTAGVGGYQAFYTGNTERMRIVGANVGIGATAPTEKLQVSGNISMPNNGSYLLFPEVSAATSYTGMRSPNGVMTDGVPWYMGVGREPGGWPISPARATMPYPQLVINNHTGIRLAAHGGYGGVSIYEQLNPAGTDWISTGREVARFRDAAYGGSYFNGDVAINGVTIGRGGGNVSSNTSTGSGALVSNTTGTNNTANGYRALNYLSSGSYNTATGYYALLQNNSSYNTAMGMNSMFWNSTGSYNTAVGVGALSNNQTGAFNTAVGFGADVPSTNISNATAIGANASVAASNRVRIGDTAITQIGGQVGWSALSDARQKENVADYSHGLDFIMKLRPVTYNLIADKTKVMHSGFIAQEVEATGVPFYGLNKPANDKDFYSLNYSEFVVPLVNSVKELKAENDALNAKVTKLESDNAALQIRIEKIEAKLK